MIDQIAYCQFNTFLKKIQNNIDMDCRFLLIFQKNEAKWPSWRTMTDFLHDNVLFLDFYFFKGRV